jgi:hypothetical protein
MDGISGVEGRDHFANAARKRAQNGDDSLPVKAERSFAERYPRRATIAFRRAEKLTPAETIQDGFRS